jgi:hypothetical protein
MEVGLHQNTNGNGEVYLMLSYVYEWYNTDTVSAERQRSRCEQPCVNRIA